MLARILEVDDRVKAYPRPGRVTAVMKIRTIGEYYPIEGWVTIDYFHVITHGEEALYAPEGADDLFWSNVLQTLNDQSSLIGHFSNRCIPLLLDPPPPPQEGLDSRYGGTASENTTWQSRTW